MLLRSDAGKNIPGSDAASQEAEKRQSADAGQSPSVASLAFGEASAALRAKNRCWLTKTTLTVNGKPFSELR